MGRARGRKKERGKRKQRDASAPEVAGEPAKEPSASKDEPRRPETLKEWALGWVKSIAIALVIWFVLQALLIKSFRIDSGSMEPSLLEQDFLFINKAVFGAKVPLLPLRTPAFRDPRAGELIVLLGIEQPVLTIVKRVIGVAGDTLELRRDSLFRNGTYVPEPYTQHVDPTARMEEYQRHRSGAWQLPQLVDGVSRDDYLPGLRDWGPFVVPEAHLFVMGDNRDASYDGRHWGFLPRENVLGSPLFIYYSWNPDDWRPLPFLTAIRWGRIFRGPW